MCTPSFSLLLCFKHAPTPHSRAHPRPHPTRVTARRKDKLEELAKTINGGAGGKVAVRDLCLRVHGGECFGFLGVNGAGKSTTFGMLTGAITPSAGDATLRGLSILSKQDELRKLVGFCPQHDALEALLTPRETLELYAHIKGVPRAAIGAEVCTSHRPRE